MAKNTNSRLRWAGLLLLIAVLFAGIAGTWKVYGKDIEDNKDAVYELKEDGSRPARKNTTDIKLVQKDIENIQISVKEMKLELKQMWQEQRQGFKEILERLP